MTSSDTPLARAGRRLGVAGRTASGPAFRALTAPPVARVGHRIATGAARLWGRILGGDERQVGDLTVVSGLPSWAFGRGGTTVGSVFLTKDAVTPDILEHEDVHRRQWERYGLWFIPMYVAAGADALQNRFEVEAGLELGGYLPKPRRDLDGAAGTARG
ncbi:hypothetical protein ACVWW9_001826 [Agrococcus sp. UYP33]